MKNILKFSNFSKIFEKRAWDTHKAPKPVNEILKNRNDYFDFFKISFAVLGALWVSQALFSNIFEKFENFRMFFIPLSFSRDKNLLIYAKVKLSENVHIFAQGGPYGLFYRPILGRYYYTPLIYIITI